MNTTEFIGILQDIQFGGITKKPREISFTVNGRYIEKPLISINSTGDGFLGAEVDIAVDSDAERCEKEVDEITIGKEVKNSRKCEYELKLVQAFACPGWMKKMKEECRGDDLIDVRMTIDDLLTIVDMVHEKREKQQKSGINITRTNDGVHVRCKRCNSSIVLVNGLKDSEEVVENFKKMRIAVYGGHFCKYCGNDLRGKVHRI